MRIRIHSLVLFCCFSAFDAVAVGVVAVCGVVVGAVASSAVAVSTAAEFGVALCACAVSNEFFCTRFAFREKCTSVNVFLKF